MFLNSRANWDLPGGRERRVLLTSVWVLIPITSNESLDLYLEMSDAAGAGDKDGKKNLLIFFDPCWASL